jgi:hypothetical protein
VHASPPQFSVSSGSINSKNGQTVKLLNRWNGHRPKINPLLADFYIYLCGKITFTLKVKFLLGQDFWIIAGNAYGWKCIWIYK